MGKNICLVTWAYSVNYGTCLQCFALSRFLEDNGYSVFIPTGFKYYYGINHPIHTALRLKDVLIEKLKNKNSNGSLTDGKRIRLKLNRSFVEQSGKLIDFSSHKQFQSFVDDMDIFISGSDQIWNPNGTSFPFFLTFAGNKPRIAFGPSIGVNTLSNKQKRYYKRMLKGYRAIGLREESAVKLLSECTDIDILNVLDPTFLLDKIQWSRVIKECSKPTYKYILCYFVGSENNKWISDSLKLADLHGCKIVNMTSEGYIDGIPSTIDVIESAGVLDFINYISNAEYVLTDSFHATAFSIIFQKEFLVYKRFRDIDAKSQNSRIYDILRRFDLSERLVNEENVCDILGKNIDYYMVNKTLDYYRLESISFLKNSLEG